VTSLFVVIAETELALRALIEWSASTAQLQDCIKKSLSQRYQQDDLTKGAEDLTFSDDASVMGYDENWKSHFKDTARRAPTYALNSSA
jgi:hypothetical protein